MVERILQLLHERGVLAKELATALRLGSSTITEWKKGKTKPSADVVVKIADYFGVSTDYLLKGNKPQSRLSNEKEDEVMDEKELRMLEEATEFLGATREEIKQLGWSGTIEMLNDVIMADPSIAPDRKEQAEKIRKKIICSEVEIAKQNVTTSGRDTGEMKAFFCHAVLTNLSLSPVPIDDGDIEELNNSSSTGKPLADERYVEIAYKYGMKDFGSFIAMLMMALSNCDLPNFDDDDKEVIRKYGVLPERAKGRVEELINMLLTEIKQREENAA